jgi:hypothetical protein
LGCCTVKCGRYSRYQGLAEYYLLV